MGLRQHPGTYPLTITGTGTTTHTTTVTLTVTAGELSRWCRRRTRAYLGHVPADALDGDLSTWWQPVAATSAGDTRTLVIDRGPGAPSFLSVRTQWYSVRVSGDRLHDRDVTEWDDVVERGDGDGEHVGGSD